MLEEFIAERPNDAFARYGLALECANNGDTDSAVDHFRELLAANPEYVPAYLQFGQLLARLARGNEARQILSAGIALARRTGDEHAGAEMETALGELGTDRS